jgi:hypothetical protein
MAQADNQNPHLPEGNGLPDSSGMRKPGRPKSTRPSLPFELRLAKELSDALRDVSRRKFTTPTEYVRRSLLAQLERDGCCPRANSDTTA